MRTFTLFVFLLLLSSQSLAQSKFVIDGRIVNKKTGDPIAYVNVGIPGKYIGTATGGNGYFSLKFRESELKDSLQISAIGFEKKRFLVSKFKKRSNRTISLRPLTYQLNPLTVVQSRDLKTAWIGKEKFGFFQRLFGVSGGSFGIAGPGKNIGAAYAFRIKWNKSLPIRILKTRMYLEKNENEDPVRLRCLIKGVNPETGWPDENLMNHSVTTSAKNKGWMTCDFSEYQVLMQEKEFFIVFEWLWRSTKRIAPMFLRDKNFNSDLFIRYTPLGRWKKNSVNVIYSVKVEY